MKKKNFMAIYVIASLCLACADDIEENRSSNFVNSKTIVFTTIQDTRTLQNVDNQQFDNGGG